MTTRSRVTRRFGKATTAAVAVGAGIVLAATAFTYTQPGSASTGVKVVDNVDDGDVTVNDMDLGELVHEKPEDVADGGYRSIYREPQAVIVFDNQATDEDADVSLDAITSDSVDPDLYDSIVVALVDQGRNEVYNGYLKDIGDAGITFVVPAGGTASFGVYAWTDREFVSTDDEAATTKNASWDIDYGYQGTEFPPDGGGTDPGTGEQTDDVPDEFDPTGELENGHDELVGDGEEPTQDGKRP